MAFKNTERTSENSPRGMGIKMTGQYEEKVYFDGKFELELFSTPLYLEFNYLNCTPFIYRI